MSAVRPYVTDPFHPLTSIHNRYQYLYIQNSVLVISFMLCSLLYALVHKGTKRFIDPFPKKTKISVFNLFFEY